MLKKEKLGLFHKDNISNIAEELFSKYGIDKTTMDDIAHKAEYSKATIYVYFKSKRELYLYIVLKGIKQIHNELTRILDENISAIDAYYNVCYIIAKYCDEKPLYFQGILDTIELDEINRKKSSITEEIYQVSEDINTNIATLLQRGITQNLFKESNDPLVTGFIHWGALSGVVSLSNTKQDYIKSRMNVTKEQFRKIGFDMLLQSILK